MAVLRVVSEISEKSAGRDNKHNHIAKLNAVAERAVCPVLPGR